MKKGFTLIEIIIGMAIVSVLTLMLSSIFAFSLDQFENSVEDHDEQFDVRVAIDLIENEIRNALRLIVFDSGEDIETELGSYSGSVNEIIALKNFGNLIYFENNVLHIGSNQYALNNVTSIVFDLEEVEEGDLKTNKLLLSVNVTGENGFVLDVEIFLNNLGAKRYYDTVDGITDSKTLPERPICIESKSRIMYLKPGE